MPSSRSSGLHKQNDFQKDIVSGGKMSYVSDQNVSTKVMGTAQFSGPCVEKNFTKKHVPPLTCKYLEILDTQVE